MPPLPLQAKQYSGTATKPSYSFDFEAGGELFRLRRTDLDALQDRTRREQLRSDAELIGSITRNGGGPALTIPELMHYYGEVEVERQRVGGQRGLVRGWSNQSRNNLLRTIAASDVHGSWAMWTLTAPANWSHVGGELVTPKRVKDWRRVFELRLQREFGESARIWKLEFQRRGAFHFHIGWQVPEGVIGRRWARTVSAWGRRAWHEVVCHPGKHGSCPGVSCPDFDHARFGARLDFEYIDRIRDSRSAFAAYFAKHGVWASKGYQNVPAGDVLRAAAALMSVLSGVPLPAVLVDCGLGLMGQMTTEDEARRQSDLSWGDTVELITVWDAPGRWWGRGGIGNAPTVCGSMTAGEVEAARLIARKVVARRTWRYIERIDGRPLILRRTLRSLHWTDDGGVPAGFWLLASDCRGFLDWFLDSVRLVAAHQGDRRSRAELLASLEEPGARPAPGSRAGSSLPSGRVVVIAG